MSTSGLVSIAEDMREIMKAFADDKEFFPAIAKAYKKMYDSLVDAGFSPEQAMQIVCSQGLSAKQS